MKLTILMSAVLLTVGLTRSACQLPACAQSSASQLTTSQPTTYRPTRVEPARVQPAAAEQSVSERPADEAAIRRVLSDQSTAWNAGDISGFMAGYLKSETLRFASGDSTTFGWQPTLERYQKRYTSRDIMGQLEFRDLKILLLSETYAEVFGSWHLTRKDTVGDASGLFTLLMKKTDQGWKVFHDHTSSAPPQPDDTDEDKDN